MSTARPPQHMLDRWSLRDFFDGARLGRWDAANADDNPAEDDR